MEHTVVETRYEKFGSEKGINHPLSQSIKIYIPINTKPPKSVFYNIIVNMEAAKKFVEETIKSKPVVVFSKTYCPFCVKAKNLLKEVVKVPADKMAVIELEDRPDCGDIQAYLKELTGASSVSGLSSVIL